MGKTSVDNDKAFLISLPGYDVKSATPEQMAVHSGFDYPKIEEDMVGVVDYTVPASVSAGTITIATVDHNLGYIPKVMCFIEDLDNIFNTEYAILPYLTDPGLSTGDVFHCTVNTTQLKLTYVIDATATSPVTLGHDFKFKYQIWVND